MQTQAGTTAASLYTLEKENEAMKQFYKYKRQAIYLGLDCL